jgi:hypothetical protein
VAHLEWELGRFDFLGCRLNCLYKNQVFAAYEQLWNYGDPFWGMVTKRPEQRPVSEETFFQDRLEGRQRWFCLRTKFLEDDYNALHIAALVDPNAVHEGFWEQPGYNLRRVQCLLGRLFKKFDTEGAQKYKDLARARHHLRWECVDWYKSAGDLIRTKSAPEDQNEIMVGFGSFLGEAAVDFLMECIDQHRRSNSEDSLTVAKGALQILQKPLTSILHHGRTYTATILERLTKLPKDGDLFKIQAEYVRQFGEATNSLYCSLRQLLPPNGAQSQDSYCPTEPAPDCAPMEVRTCMSMDKKRNEAWTQIIQNEWEYYKKRFPNSEPPCVVSATPIVYVPDEFIQGRTYEDEFQRISKAVPHGVGAQGDGASLDALYDFLAGFRREQKKFLFYKCPADVTKPGLSLREQENVLYRIQNYVLLYSRDENCKLREDVTGSDKDKEVFLSGWTSRGLFYYLRSLVPLEIQIRTMLSDTLSEQYHDAVYKGAPPKGAEFPRALMQTIARKLDDIDKEMQIDFEDYVNRWYLSKLTS